jgi:hypothetical protein
MFLSPLEMMDLLREAGEIVAMLNHALRRDAEDGVVRLDRDERRELLRRLAKLTAHFVRDALD